MFWEDLARRESSFPVLDDRGSEVATPDFLATGEADLSALLTAAASMIGRDIDLHSSLDFGCGAGRLTLPLARRAKSVTACDISPTMLEHARHNAEAAGLHNISYVLNDELSGSFTFICSLLVFQYVPRSTGYETMQTLLRLLAPSGVAILHFALAGPGEALRQLARMHRAKPKPSNNRLQIHQYDERVVHRRVEETGARIVGRFSAPIGEIAGAVFVIEKGPL